MLFKFFKRKTLADDISMLYRRDGLMTQMNFLLDTLEQSKFDILYMENLKNPLSESERIYFLQQIDRIESSKKIIIWMQDNIMQNAPFWKKLLKW